MKKLNLKSIAALTAAAAMTLSLTACTQTTGGDTGGAGNTQQQSGGTTYNVAVVKQMDHASLDEIEGVHKLAGWVELKVVENVSRSAFDVNANPGEGVAPIGTVTTNDMILPIAGNVVCYNKTTKTWFASLDEARAYADTLTIYYDRAPQEGGKVRLVVVG